MRAAGLVDAEGGGVGKRRVLAAAAGSQCVEVFTHA